MKTGYLLAVLACGVAVAAVAASIILNPPDEVRKREIDNTRVQDLQELRMRIISYNTEHHRLPPDLAAMATPGLTDKHWNDPETGIPYEYEPTGDKSYKLCAVFSFPTDHERYCCSPNDIGAHGAGKFCFALTVQ